MASPGNQHCANCIGTLLFPINWPELSMLIYQALIGHGNVTSVGWQVTLCDLIWHVSFQGGVAG